ncbi:GNAT family N-acetyltransferase [Helicobacter kayseriensis]|uniref:GNAT family N-acetyltransferase n=1 Tax=Helicobacter kayseriensis TaxID=2905877 RepID=UPI001E568043|nr:GNAT family N-acetyltransferase [Helicobacter kayseriensis]MCE3047836.1 GNAT family N-acetyltransferase [Helicobacter kayseriensis]MCE3049206.1 GNAT family N-acetyltransferase [Helicobacter kayseriensis]
MNLEIFLHGETIDLYIPTIEYIKENRLYTWWNNPDITAYLDSGAFPNTLSKQIAYYEKYLDQDLILLIGNKEKEIIGSIALSSIDYRTKKAELGIIMGRIFRKNPLESLESVARITEHAFLKIGLDRVNARQHIGLIHWSNRMSLIGYRIEGIYKNGFVKGKEKADQFHIACSYEDYCRIIANRGGGRIMG